MKPQDYEAWLAGGRSTGTAVQNGERLFTDLACITCHKTDSTGRGPSLLGVFGSRWSSTDGRKVVADENYLRESIMNSQAKIVKGYQGIMPAFQGMVSEENLMQLIAYIKTLKPAAAGRRRRASKDGFAMSNAVTERQSYLDAPHGIASWLLTKDHKRIAMLYLISITIFFAVGGLFALGIRLELLTPKGDLLDARHVQQAVHAARRGDDLLLPDSVDSGDARQLPHPDHVRDEGPGLPADQPAELVPLRASAASSALRGDPRRRARHGLDVLHAVQHDRRRRPASRWPRWRRSSPASRRSSPASTSSSPSTACARRA